MNLLCYRDSLDCCCVAHVGHGLRKSRLIEKERGGKELVNDEGAGSKATLSDYTYNNGLW
jgi:hypothetical protein